MRSRLRRRSPVSSEGDAIQLRATAPVGGTGYIMLVQSRVEDAVRPSRTLAKRLASGFAVAMVGVFAMIGRIMLRTRSRNIP
jgi:hypothetical protein